MANVADGYEATDRYQGICVCDGQLVVINLFAFLSKFRTSDELQQNLSLQNELAVLVLHEIAHMLEWGSGHGTAWRQAFSQLIAALLNHDGPSGRGASGN
eukprot:gnl/TRDRNA2_/TRDRNA2_129685_c0_seq1.p2 gnl/TRDRNA2_/TRDRNA2_129685_c0~~gnl/TRDRNA2_/TRDRNA2_129685_c0_seq1.p2  ORF type:complete len:100 (+),score=14.53 gnl/TRDRNA2_/TRDRNA2_129685_c0_seq1:124-423(+)